MRLLRALRASLRDEPALWALLAFALLLRLPALGYGLPLMLVNDEPPFTLAALKMLQLHTLIPALHLAAFKSILYYPPYLAYLYLPFFALIAGAEYLHFGAGAAAHLAADFSPFFIIARCIDLAFALGSLYLAYRITERLTRSRPAALVAAFLLATSLIHLALSVVARQWMPVAFLFSLALWVLSEETLAERRRYLYALLIAGVGMGFSAAAGLILLMTGLWWLVFGKERLTALLADGALWGGAAAFVALAALPSLLYPGSSGFTVDLTIFDPKSLAGLLAAPWHALRTTLYSEPVLALLAALGFFMLAAKVRRLALFIALWWLGYVVVFYFVFRFEARFMLPMVPLYALLGGAAIERLIRSHAPLARACAVLLLLIPLAASLRLSYLGAVGDTRVTAREYALTHLSAADSIIVYAPLTRLPTTAAAVTELAAIDPGALRSADEADRTLDKRSLPHALNLYAVNDPALFATLGAYAQAHGYEYLLLDQSYAAAHNESSAFASLTKGATEVARWQGLDGAAALDASDFPASPVALFSGAHLGPTLVLYRLGQ